MQLDASLHKAVLAGTSRVTLDAAAGAAAPLRPLLEQGRGSALWLSLAAQDAWQRAGYLPLPAGAEDCEASARDDAAQCPLAAEDVLHMILRGIHAELLPAWLAQARAHGLSLPHACLVALVEQSLTRPQLREQLAPLLGARGSWLLAQNPEWAQRYGEAAHSGAAADWNAGNLAQRTAALRAMRGSDPAAALQALQADWAQEPSENRMALLPCLATGLSLADEAFLERALDDKRKEVRSAARSLLAGLPGSQLGERCKARLAAATRLEGGRIEVVLPEACDKDMKRDGIGLQKPWNMGEKAGWLMDMAQCIPPAWWTGRWQLAPAEVLRLLAGQEFSVALLTGLCGAAGNSLRAGAPDAVAWFLALLAVPAANGLDTAQLLMPQFSQLPPAAQQQVLLAWLEDVNPRGLQHALAWAHQALDTPGIVLSPQLSCLFLRKLQGMMTSAADQPSYSLRGGFKTLAQLLSVEDMAYVQDGWPAEHWEHWPNWRELADDFRETLQFRNTLLRSFTENKE